VGYKWFDSKGYLPEFPFGFGLSYTTFQFSNAALRNDLSSATNPSIQVTFDLTNTGAMAGAEVAEVYLTLPAAGEAPKRLVGWQKVLLGPGERQSVTVEVDENDSSHPLAYWDTKSGGWMLATGGYTVYVGDSSAMSALHLAGTFKIGM